MVVKKSHSNSYSPLEERESVCMCVSVFMCEVCEMRLQKF